MRGKENRRQIPVYNMKVVKHYADAFSANLAKGMLENEGIPAAVLHQDQAFAGIYNKLGYIDLAVNEEDYSRALELIEKSESAASESME